MKCLPLILFLASVVSCVPVTPAARIDQARDRFEQLPASHQELIRQGQVARGMCMDAVRFAWGPPDSVLVGSRDGRESARWDYTRLRPVFFDGYGWTGFARPWHPEPFFGPAVLPPSGYIPIRSATVWFIDGKVDAWERLQ